VGRLRAGATPPPDPPRRGRPPAAPRAAPLSLPPHGRDPVDRLRQRLESKRRRLDDLLAAIVAGAPTPDELHRAHRDLRRIRIDGALWAGLVPRGRAAGYPATDRTVRDLGRAVGSARNLDVAVDLLTPPGARHPAVGSLSPELAPAVRRLRGYARTERRRLARLVTGGLRAAFLDGIERPLRAALPPAAAERLAERLEETTTVRIARLERALARAYRRPTVERLHAVRIELRAVRYLDQLRVEVLGATHLDGLGPFARLQPELGRLNDVDVARRLAKRLPAGPARGRVRTLLGARRKALRRRIVRTLGEKPVRRAFEALLDSSPG